jgi:hypothetical protein
MTQASPSMLLWLAKTTGMHDALLGCEPLTAPDGMLAAAPPVILRNFNANRTYSPETAGEVGH